MAVLRVCSTLVALSGLLKAAAFVQRPSLPALSHDGPAAGLLSMKSDLRCGLREKGTRRRRERRPELSRLSAGGRPPAEVRRAGTDRGRVHLDTAV